MAPAVARFARSLTPFAGVNDIKRKPNYDFERRERERNKAIESARKAQAKADRRVAEQGYPDSGDSGPA